MEINTVQLIRHYLVAKDKVIVRRLDENDKCFQAFIFTSVDRGYVVSILNFTSSPKDVLFEYFNKASSMFVNLAKEYKIDSVQTTGNKNEIIINIK